ncbi:bifunctional phosphoribosyl-AMP cyclohydrolase/phosphoribosyl-ATP diphosphatase HisIE [Hymenobacter busanensis]|uniref:Histidine biosynthesis bifunctional protein HisIE n=1 Tax=Hymenobacter busanensis TaxID=2607656 RepID=A0A7L4ZW01_9BACT|nr:bifunctional phosphoribosyl-AMP cyclohydrolase/phosphoribosyl-ATP diphosphatase HisIE [Hymenobacter busanensis]KAA9339855.1 bifunctional phosphoribosyl-AMP cyclohydrolase/phosphoribosyl-ATP diphosphatase HisIE [Hymenobacter busanensis]QHJ06392.1 bifunctional phosphoribosyl-AMP cyclohydrolase/phosphoribosyl-ATP diphosphatase HisIE [Hymenobacter busanensis]
MTLDFDKMGGLIPAVVQDADTGQVLMLGYVNEEALRKTEQEGRVTFFSRSKNRLWTKGETSGHFLAVESLHPDCDGDALLIRARPDGPTCHRGTTSCFEQANETVYPAAPVGFLAELERLVQRRRANPTEEPNSYTAKLFAKGLPKIAQKVGEEAVETVIDAVAGNRAGLPGEAADLLYHLLVLLAASDLALPDVIEVLRQRHSTISTGQRRSDTEGI